MTRRWILMLQTNWLRKKTGYYSLFWETKERLKLPNNLSVLQAWYLFLFLSDFSVYLWEARCLVCQPLALSDLSAMLSPELVTDDYCKLREFVCVSVMCCITGTTQPLCSMRMSKISGKLRMSWTISSLVGATVQHRTIVFHISSGVPVWNLRMSSLSYTVDSAVWMDGLPKMCESVAIQSTTHFWAVTAKLPGVPRPCVRRI